MSYASSGLPQYAIRISDGALDDIDDARAQIAKQSGEDVAQEWLDGLREALTTLAASPFRAIVPESRHFVKEIRQILYRCTAYGVAYRVLFRVIENPLDAPFVTVLAVRHSAQAPITNYEARQIEARQ